ncbi:MAG: Ig-like domain-containing protein [Prevotella sp.]|nr:Ig-like domain-containing protein [Prevotella sp.]
MYQKVSSLKVAGATDPVQIEYIETTTTMSTVPYINTGYYFTANTDVEMEYALGDKFGNDWNALFGARNYFVSDVFAFYGYGGSGIKGTFARNAETHGTVDLPKNQKLKLTTSGTTCTIEDASGTTLSTITGGTAGANTNYPLIIFGIYNWSDGVLPKNQPAMKLYRFKIYESGVLQKDFVPVVTSDGKGALKDLVSGTIYNSANTGEFELSPDGQTAAADNGVTVYEGKLVVNTTDNHMYKYTNGSFVDQGAITLQTISDTNYRNLSNWTHAAFYDSTFGVNVYDATNGTNLLNPYEGKSGWEPLSYKLTGLTKGDAYRVSFNYSCAKWYGWPSYYSSPLPFYVFDNESMPSAEYNPGASGSLVYIPLPQAATTNEAHSHDFTAAHNFALMCIQFGVVDDGSHNPAFSFNFDNITVEHYVYPTRYGAITWTDPVKYTELEYIESTGATRENPFTLPYRPITATQIGMKFRVYDTSSGWCAIFSGRNIYAGTGISLYKNGNNNNKFGYFTGGTTSTGDNFADFSYNTDYTITADVTNLNINGTNHSTGNTETNATTRNLSIFANPEWDNPMRGRIYYCTISENGETIYDFKPVMRHDGVYGYYDAATHTFVQPVQGSYTGYGFATKANESYVYYPADTRTVVVGSTQNYQPTKVNMDGATFTWTSSDTSKATVAADGTVTGVAAGTVTITATTDAHDGWTASYELIVSEPNYIRHDVNNVGYAVVTGGEGWNDGLVEYLVDNDATTKFGCSSAENAWAIIIAEQPVAVGQYSLVMAADSYNYPGRIPRSWKLEGSNDNQTWTTIDERTQDYAAITSSKEETVFTPSDYTTTYKFFKFTATAFDGGFQLGELWINEQVHTWGEPAVTAATCTTEGKSVKECSDCHTLQTTYSPIVAHNFVNGACSVCEATSEVALLPDGQTNPYTVKFRHMTGSDNTVDIETDWNTAAFDDSAWDDMLMPLGTYGVYKTRWLAEYNTFWMRRTFSITDKSQFAAFKLKTLHDDDYKIYVNGHLVHEALGWTNNTNWYETYVDPSYLVNGTNVVAVYIEQNYGGAYCDFSLTGLKATNVTIGSALYATYIPPFDVTTTGSGVTAYTIQLENIQNGWVTLTEVTNIPAGAPVIVHANASGTYPVNPTTTAASELTGNILRVASSAITVETAKTIYGLFNYPQLSGVGFYPLKVGATVPQGKVYYQLASSGEAKDFYALFGDDATGIEGVIVNRLDGTQEIYNLRGQKLDKLERGVNIVNGKKIVVK